MSEVLGLGPGLQGSAFCRPLVPCSGPMEKPVSQDTRMLVGFLPMPLEHFD